MWLIPTVIFSSAFHYGWLKTWNSLAIYSQTPPFMDLRTVPEAVQVAQHGGDPLQANPLDRYERPFNYPRIWLYLFGFLHITEHNTWIVGLLFSVLYLLCVSKLILDAKHRRERFTFLLAGLSIAPLFGMERGNTDLPVFALVFLGSLLLKAPQRAGLLLLATLLKLFPFVALVAEAIRQRRKARVWPAALTVVALVLLAFQWKDMLLIHNGTPVSSNASYGVYSLQLALWVWLMAHRLMGATTEYVPFLGVAACWIGAIAVFARVWRRPSRFSQEILQSHEGVTFFLFASIYASTFVIGSNWEYRLVFLLPTLPFAFRVMGKSIHKRWAICYILAVLFAENCVDFMGGFKGLLTQAGTIAVFFLVLPVITEQLKVYSGIESKSELAIQTESLQLETPTLCP